MQYYSREKKEMKAIVIISFVLMLAVQALSYIGIFSERSLIDIFRKYDALVLPHPYTAFLWPILCFFLLYFVIFQTGKPGYGAKKDAIESVTLPFSLSCILAGAWPVFWSRDLIWVTLVFTAVMAVVLNFSYFRLERIKPYLYNDEKRGLLLPISLFLAVVMNVLVLNIVAFTQSMGWNFFGIPKAVLSILTLFVIVVINTAYIMLRRNFSFSFVSFVLMGGIFASRFLEGEIMPVGYVAALGALFILIVTINSKRKNVNKSQGQI